ncbi:copper amine oxidase N-terminal domain-containing protein [Paenibacillus alkaliterrae]|uniref:copper amine oxidase N-terminal domain-containing protein n=1 Tax=Paenibacillus alkaliterrae TaxID=320909 RepID=UPI001F28BA0B|nr:copper amine oxidase N-terminal domain-containing protein [Paenibacillus alkaliterrae]MCF2939396.1 copper amine oxidase N-terminal domain-containing protein [Paenibacillus alkaliterrae]
MKNKIAAMLTILMLCLAVSGLAPGAAQAASTIKWGEEKSGVYNQIHPYTLNWTGNVLDRGGLNLFTMEYTTDSSEADIVINQYGDIGALSIRKLAAEELTAPTERYTSGFSNSLEMEQGALYLVALHDGTHAKFRIDRILPDNGFTITQVRFSYVLETPEDEGWDGQNGGNDLPSVLEIGSPAQDVLNPSAEYVFEGDGTITIPWEQLPGEYTWDIYRSDNGAPYMKMTDFKITETEYSDHYTFVGHTYLYKLASYDRDDNLIAISPAIMVTIVAEGDAEPTVPENLIVLQLGNRTAYVNDKAFTLETSPFLHNGRTLIPLRFVSEALGATVKWNQKDKSITLTMNSDTIVLVIDKSVARVNGKNIMMDVPASIYGNITMVPIRFVSEQLKQNISFDNKTQKIVITSQKAAGSSASGKNGNSNSGSQTSAADASYFIGSWKMWVPAGSSGADGGTLTIYKDGTISFYWNGPKTGTWTYDKATGKLLLTGYKSGWDWTVTQSDTGITVSTLGVYETGTRAN